MTNKLAWLALWTLMAARVLTGLCGVVGLLMMAAGRGSATPSWFFAAVFLAMILASVSTVTLNFVRSEV